MGSKNSAIGAAFWSLVDKFSTQAVSFIISIILARLLTPTDYGIVGLMSIFLVISNVFIDAGFGNAIIRKTDRTAADLSTAFYFNISISCIIYIILWFLAPCISTFFNEPLLVPLVRIASFNLVLGSLCIVHQALLTVDLRIKEQTYIALISQIPAGIIAIFCAYKGLGVYSLAIQALIASLVKCLAFWYVAKWAPHRVFSKDSFRYLMGFGSKLVCANVIGVAFDKIYSVLIGKFIGKAPLGYFTKAEALDNQVFSVSNGMVQRIALPILSKSQSDKILLKERFREIMRLLVMVNVLIAAFIFVEAKSIIVFLWTEKWLQTADILSILALANIWIPIGSLSLVLLQVVNRTDIVLKLEFPKKIIYICIIYVGFQFGVLGLSIGFVLINMVAAFINMYVTKDILQYSYISQIIDIFKYIIYASISTLVTLFFSYNISILVLDILIHLLQITSVYILILLFARDEIALKYLKKIKSKLINSI